MVSVAGAGGEGQRSGVCLGRIDRVGLNRAYGPTEAFILNRGKQCLGRGDWRDERGGELEGS